LEPCPGNYLNFFYKMYNRTYGWLNRFWNDLSARTYRWQSIKKSGIELFHKRWIGDQQSIETTLRTKSTKENEFSDSFSRN
jgi:hypothetical protein